MREVVFAPGAREEFEAAAEWYDSQQRGLGSEFVALVDETIRLVQAQPMAFCRGDLSVAKAGMTVLLGTHDQLATTVSSTTHRQLDTTVSSP